MSCLCCPATATRTASTCLMHVSYGVTACKQGRLSLRIFVVLPRTRNCSQQSDRLTYRPDVDLMAVALQKPTLRKSKRLQQSNKLQVVDRTSVTEVIKICISRAVFARMTTLSSNAGALYAQPRVCHLKAQGNRRCPQRRGVFRLTVRGSFAESGGFESSPSYQVRLKRSSHASALFFAHG